MSLGGRIREIGPSFPCNAVGRHRRIPRSACMTRNSCVIPRSNVISRLRAFQEEILSLSLFSREEGSLSGRDARKFSNNDRETGETRTVPLKLSTTISRVSIEQLAIDYPLIPILFVKLLFFFSFWGND